MRSIEDRLRNKDLKNVQKSYFVKTYKQECQDFIDKISRKQDYILDIRSKKTRYIKEEFDLVSEVELFQIIAIRDFEVQGRQIKKGQRGAWIQEGVVIERGSWADEESMILKQTKLLNETYVEQSNVYENVSLKRCIVKRSRIHSFDFTSCLSMVNCDVFDSKIEFNENHEFIDCTFENSQITSENLIYSQNGSHFKNFCTEDFENNNFKI